LGQKERRAISIIQLFAESERMITIVPELEHRIRRTTVSRGVKGKPFSRGEVGGGAIT